MTDEGTGERREVVVDDPGRGAIDRFRYFVYMLAEEPGEVDGVLSVGEYQLDCGLTLQVAENKATQQGEHYHDFSMTVRLDDDQYETIFVSIEGGISYDGSPELWDDPHVAPDESAATVARFLEKYGISDLAEQIEEQWWESLQPRERIEQWAQHIASHWAGPFYDSIRSGEIQLEGNRQLVALFASDGDTREGESEAFSYVLMVVEDYDYNSPLEILTMSHEGDSVTYATKKPGDRRDEYEESSPPLDQLAVVPFLDQKHGITQRVRALDKKYEPFWSMMDLRRSVSRVANSNEIPKLEQGDQAEIENVEMMGDLVETIVRKLTLACKVGQSKSVMFGLENGLILKAFINRGEELLSDDPREYIAALDVVKGNQSIEGVYVADNDRRPRYDINEGEVVGEDMSDRELVKTVGEFIDRYHLLDLAELVEERVILETKGEHE